MEALFRDVFGRHPDVVAYAPGRVNLIGDHTDYNEGFVLPIALPQGVRVSAAHRSDGLLVARSRNDRFHGLTAHIDALEPGVVTGWASYVAGVCWALRDAGHRLAGVDILVDGEVPRGSGLSSSAALECATVMALAELFGFRLDGVEAARIAQRAENEFVGVPCGIMDQMASLLCIEGHALFIDTRTLEFDQIPFAVADPRRRADGDAPVLVVVDTGVKRALVDSEYAARRQACEEAANELGVKALRDIEPGQLDDVFDQLEGLGRGADVARRRVRHVVTENDRVTRTADLLRQRRTREIGPLLNESHASLRDDYEVSSPELDTAVDAARDAGALGARMTGAGFGGCAIVVIDQNTERDEVVSAIETAFARAGYLQPRTFAVAPSDGALGSIGR